MRISKRNSSESTHSSSTKTDRSKDQPSIYKNKTRSLSQTNIYHRNKDCNQLFNILNANLKQKGLKYIRDNKQRNNILFREEMANLIDYGDCHYKLDASLCLKNKNNIYKQYKMIREEADVKEIIPVKIHFSNQIEENNTKISRLYYSNKVRYNHLMSKC